MILAKKFSWAKSSLLVVAVFLTDQLTKYYASEKFFFGTKIIYNSGLPFGIGGSEFFSLAIVVASLTIFVFLYFRFWTKVESHLGFALIVGGAVSNIFDRVQDGVVTDFIDLWITTLNVADLAIMGGIVFLILNLRTHEPKSL